MTNEQAKKMLKAKLECLKNETSGINHDCNMRLCDGCSLNYEQGNMGEQKEALEMAIQALEQEPCEDCVSRNDVVKAISDWIIEGEYDYTNATNYLVRRINYLPSVTPKPKIGRWLAMSEGFTPYECSECETVEFKKSKYCPRCGTKMEVARND